MKRLNITKERFEKSRYFQKKYGKLEYVSESGKLFKTDTGKILKFKESARKFTKESGEELYAEINLWPDDLQMWDELLNEEIDYDEYDFDEESTVFKETAQFEDGCFADLKVNTNDREDGTLWAEVVLFDPEGHQLAYSEPNYSGISGEWELEADGKTYIVSVGSR